MFAHSALYRSVHAASLSASRVPQDPGFWHDLSDQVVTDMTGLARLATDMTCQAG